MRNRGWKRLLESQLPAFVICDMVLIAVCMFGALWVRHDFHIMEIDVEFIGNLCRYLPVNLCCTLLLFKLFHLYNNLWQFAGLAEFYNVVAAVVLTALLQTIGMAVMGLRIPRSYPFLYLLLLMAAICSSRFLVRFLYREHQKDAEGQKIRTMIVGAGVAGSSLIREMKGSQHLNRVIPCIIDDSPAKKGTFLHGIPVVGSSREIPRYARKYHIKEIVIAIPSLTPLAKKRILEACQETTCKTLILPGMYQIINGEVNVSMLRQVEINDLLGRPPVELEMDSIMDYVSGKVILVTGGGGSIGSEICRQLALHQPRKLIVFDLSLIHI